MTCSYTSDQYLSLMILLNQSVLNIWMYYLEILFHAPATGMYSPCNIDWTQTPHTKISTAPWILKYTLHTYSHLHHHTAPGYMYSSI